MIASSFGSVHDFFHSSTWYVTRNLAIFFVFVFWVATVYWVYKDARRRIEDPLIVWRRRPLIGLVPFIGPLIYMLFRPPEYLEDVRERELEIKAMEKRLGGARPALPGLPRRGRRGLPRLPRLHDEASPGVRHAADRPLEPLWQVCPYCETPIEYDVDAPAVPLGAGQAPAAPRRR